ncbi:MAG: RNA-directed DNA polymerase [Leptolyngbyaceae cyanobacterium RM2_2_4]|nr:RNA-directed DNA polymerase [Leptolyngbyaceae cyanobacterium SM1_4_3]NJN92230.1 RNA-directed DNA polymerase [Leptolyngbyaceae cyanobacterium SL_5_14]NJO52221.1 RNA-directed DNA polymerase [Leptolyngbyaceae cyanobacterium RM2_2_4]
MLKENSTLILYKNCNELRQEFLALKSPRDIAELLEVKYEQLVYHLYKAPGSSKYKEFSISKKSGHSRTISAPSSALKILQRKLSQVLYSVYDPKYPVHGFLPEHSIVTNAKQHLRKKFVLNIDLKNFFDAIHFGRVRGIFLAPPYKLPEEVATVLAQICCHSNKLPQGAPTSPVVSNIVCTRIDSQLRLLAKELRCNYTRYADDITLSTTRPNFPIEIAYESSEDNKVKIVLGERLISIVQNNGFEINDRKIRLQHRSQHQEVTGLTVNQFPNVKRDYVREISSMLHVWDKFGLASASQRYAEKRSRELEISQEEVPSFQEVLRGKINFLGMVRGKENEIYRKYLNWYYILSNRSETPSGG